jgi:hypothetical protein
LRPSPAALAANKSGDEPTQTAHAVHGDGANANAPAAMATATVRPAGAEPRFTPADSAAAPPSQGASQEIPEDAPVDTIGVARPVFADEAGAIVSVPDSVPVPAPRTHLPFFVAQRRPQNSRF